MRGTSGDTRKRILDAATELFYGDGIRSRSVDAVAARARVTKRTLYYHFASKDALIAAYLESRHEPVLANLIASITQTAGDSTEQVRGLFSRLARAVRTPAWKGCPFARAAAELQDAGDLAALQVAAKHKATFEEWLRQRFAAQGLADPTRLARQILVLMDGAITEMLIRRDPEYAVAAGEAAVALVAAAAAGGKRP